MVQSTNNLANSINFTGTNYKHLIINNLLGWSVYGFKIFNYFVVNE